MIYKRIKDLCDKAELLKTQISVLYQMHGKYGIDTFKSDIVELEKDLKNIERKIIKEAEYLK